MGPLGLGVRLHLQEKQCLSWVAVKELNLVTIRGICTK